jgi:hypothetical protein
MRKLRAHTMIKLKQTIGKYIIEIIQDRVQTYDHTDAPQVLKPHK